MIIATEELIKLMKAVQQDELAYKLLWVAAANSYVYEVLAERGDPRLWPEYLAIKAEQLIVETKEAVDG